MHACMQTCAFIRVCGTEINDANLQTTLNNNQ